MARKKKEANEPGGFNFFGVFSNMAKAGWTPSEANAFLDRLEALGDVNNINTPDQNVGDEEDEEEAEELDEQELDGEESNEDAEDEDDEDEGAADENNASKDTNEVKKPLDRMKEIGLEVENERLKKELKLLKAKNRSKDVSGSGKQKPLEDRLVDSINEIF